MNILFATDIHGDTAAYAELAAQARLLRPDAVVLGGDLLPKGGPFQDVPAKQRKFVKSFLPGWLRQIEAPVYWLLGNDDMGYLAETFAQWDRDGRAYYLHERVRSIGDDWKIYGYSYVPVTPFSLKDWEKFDYLGQDDPTEFTAVFSTPGGFIPLGETAEALVPRGTIEEDFQPLVKRDWRRTILVTHTPPFDTALDVAYDGRRIGSRAVRRFLEKAQPPLSLHGHIHESPDRSGSMVDAIGRTTCANPGASLGGLRAILCTEGETRWDIAPVGSGHGARGR